ncbi:MAG: hypothetical protein GXP42_02205 [Chloroflexi bacterium]|nr:hypothetical protein [Chloroflexota bacterium]
MNHRRLFTSLLCALAAWWLAPAAALAEPPEPHRYIQEYEGPQTCELCHVGVTDEVMHSVHYTWEEKMMHYSPIPASVARINWLGVLNPEMEIAGGCGRCHIGGGVMPGTEAANSPEAAQKIDCLICHAETYDMKARYPQQDENGNWIIPGDRSLAAARTAARPSDEACLRCHLNAGGGKLFKRGVDFAPVADKHASESYGDIHAEQGMVCVDCHRAPEHKFYGFAPTLWSRDREDERLTCASCHGDAPHENVLLNEHQRLDCRVCHVPFTGGLVKRDWMAPPVYDPIKELYAPVDEVAAVNSLVPTYLWFNGDRLKPGQPWPGEYGDLDSRLQPFKMFVGVVPANPETGKPWPLKLGVFYKTGDQLKAMLAGAQALDMEWTGEWTRKEIRVPLQISHGVVGADKALGCQECHTPNGRLDFAALGYDEARVALLESISSPQAGTPRPLQVDFRPNAQPLPEIETRDDVPVESGLQLPWLNRWSWPAALLIAVVALALMAWSMWRLRRRAMA